MPEKLSHRQRPTFQLTVANAFALRVDHSPANL